MLEVGRIFQFSEGRHAVALGLLPSFDVLRAVETERGTEKQRVAACKLESVDH
jgi:hypothetical protein